MLAGPLRGSYDLADGAARPPVQAASRVGIRSRVLALALMAMAVPAVLASAYFESRARERLRLAEIRAVDEAKAGARDLDALVAQIRMMVTALSAIPEVRRGEGAACADTLRRLLPTAGWLASLSVVRTDGYVLCSTNPMAPGLNIGSQLHLRQALASRRFVFSDLAISRVHGSTGLHAVEPVLREGGLGRGAAGGRARLGLAAAKPARPLRG